MDFRLRGPEGVQRRIAEIQRRIEEKIGAPENPDAARDFPGELVGSIANRGGSAPINPFGSGLSIDGFGGAARFGTMAREAAARAGVDPILFESLISAESAFDPAARSRAGAMGLAQLMPETAQSLGVKDPFDPQQSLEGGARYFSQMLAQFDGDPKLALAAYNAGPGAVHKYGGIPPYRETRRYVDRIMSLYEARRQP